MENTYTLSFTASFADSFEEHIHQWEEFGLSEQSIQKFVGNIQSSLELLEYNPEMFEDIADRYAFDKPTFRITVGNRYAIFFRIDDEKRQVLVGSLFSQNQMNVSF